MTDFGRPVAAGTVGMHETHERARSNDGRPLWNTPEAIDLMRRLWSEGKSASEIGSLLGVTKNAILGKIHRLGLRRNVHKAPLEPRPPRPRTRAATARTPAAKEKNAQPGPSDRGAVSEPERDRKEKAIPLFRVRPVTCRWPLWADDAKPDHSYCDKPAVAAWPGVYCAECRIKAFARTASPANEASEALPDRGGDRHAA
jgi:GcrA cell cycle regulator